MDLKDDKFEHLKGTTTVGMICKDGVVFATDTRATAGYLVASKEARKIYKITDNIAFTTAGAVADTQKLVDLLRAESGYYAMHEGVPMGVGACARLLANILHIYSMFPYIANILVGGIEADRPRLFFLDIEGGLTEEEMVATGSGSPVAYGVLEGEFVSKLTAEEAFPIAVKALRTAMKRDIATGNEVMVASITKKGYQELPPEEIKKLA
jgi:proteasome beta subunit